MKILVTGAAGFIGHRVTAKLLGRGDSVVGVDNLNEYYPRELKFARLAQLGIGDAASMLSDNPEGDGTFPAPSRFCGKFRFYLCDLADRSRLPAIFERERFDAVFNFAAMAGARHSAKEPFDYMESNVVGFLNLLECCRSHSVKHLSYASSSSVYGCRETVPFSETDRAETPASFYAATKKADELMAYSYSSLYGIPSTALRFFTVYGPWGRPDMAPMIFAKAIREGTPLKLFNGGDMVRDFTYIDDAAEAAVRILDNPPVSENGSVPHRIYNIGCSAPVRITDFVSELERALGKKAVLEMMPMQSGDVHRTCADISAIGREVGFRPWVSLREGVENFARWYDSDNNPLK